MNLTKLCAVAKQLKTHQELARQLWKTEDTAAKLLPMLLCRPKAFEWDELDEMLRRGRERGRSARPDAADHREVMRRPTAE